MPQVDSVFTSRTDNFKNSTLYWRPYYLYDNDTQTYKTFLYAGNAPTSSNPHDSWNARLIYINGKLYESPKNGLGISQVFRDNKNLDDAEKWLAELGFKECP